MFNVDITRSNFNTHCNDRSWKRAIISLVRPFFALFRPLVAATMDNRPSLLCEGRVAIDSVGLLRMVAEFLCIRPFCVGLYSLRFHKYRKIGGQSYPYSSPYYHACPIFKNTTSHPKKYARRYSDFSIGLNVPIKSQRIQSHISPVFFGSTCNGLSRHFHCSSNPRGIRLHFVRRLFPQ